MTAAAPIEAEQLSRRVLGIIGAYGMGAPLDAPGPRLTRIPADQPPEQVLVPDEAPFGDAAAIPVASPWAAVRARA